MHTYTDHRERFSNGKKSKICHNIFKNNNLKIKQFKGILSSKKVNKIICVFNNKVNKILVFIT